MPWIPAPQRTGRIDLFVSIGHEDRQWHVHQHARDYVTQCKRPLLGIVMPANIGDLLKQFETIVGVIVGEDVTGCWFNEIRLPLDKDNLIRLMPCTLTIP